MTEWVKALAAQKGNTKAAWFQSYGTFLFNLFDVSSAPLPPFFPLRVAEGGGGPLGGDHVLDIAEYADGMSAYGFPEADSHAAFAKFAVVNAASPWPPWGAGYSGIWRTRAGSPWAASTRPRFASTGTSTSTPRTRGPWGITSLASSDQMQIPLQSAKL